MLGIRERNLYQGAVRCAGLFQETLNYYDLYFLKSYDSVTHF